MRLDEFVQKLHDQLDLSVPVCLQPDPILKSSLLNIDGIMTDEQLEQKTDEYNKQ